ncbi:MAG: hypothetical protein ACRD2E_02180 [Terriglobales bacterium]
MSASTIPAHGKEMDPRSDGTHFPMGHLDIATVADPGPAPISQGFRQTLWVALAIGVVLFLLGTKFDPGRVWRGVLVNYLFFLILGLGGLFLVALEYVASTTWSVVFRRLAESAASYLPWALLLSPLLMLAAPHLYPWAQHGFHFKRVAKQSYYRLGYFDFRTGLFVAIWAAFGTFFIGRSLKQDKEGGQGNLRVPKGWGKLSSKNGRMAAFYIPVFAITFTLASADWVMSLQTGWSSSMFGVYAFAGMFEAAFALMVIVAVMMRRRRWLGEIVTDHHYVDLTRMMHAFCIFMVYIGFEQYFIIWYSNQTDETAFFHRRLMGGWSWLFLFLVLAKWAVPFVVLMVQKLRTKEGVILTMAWLVLIAEYCDVYWLVMPAHYAHFVLPSWSDLGAFLLFFAVFSLSMCRLLRKHSTVPIGDPKLVNSVAGRYL